MSHNLSPLKEIDAAFNDSRKKGWRNKWIGRLKLWPIIVVFGIGIYMVFYRNAEIFMVYLISVIILLMIIWGFKEEKIAKLKKIIDDLKK